MYWPSALAYSTRLPLSLTSYSPAIGLALMLSIGVSSCRLAKLLRMVCSAASSATTKVETNAMAAAAIIWVKRMGTPEGRCRDGRMNTDLETRGCQYEPGRRPLCEPAKPTTVGPGGRLRQANWAFSDVILSARVMLGVHLLQTCARDV